MNYIGRGSYPFLVSEIVRMAETFKEDLKQYNALKPGEMYDFIRAVPYVDEKRETLKRPAVLIRDGGDCDDKTIALLAYAFNKGIPARVYLAGKKSDPEKFHHVFPAFFLSGKWFVFDATYTWCRLGQTMDCWDNFKIFWG
jgi:transglutaminase-like putative cysteine protease